MFKFFPTDDHICEYIILSNHKTDTFLRKFMAFEHCFARNAYLVSLSVLSLLVHWNQRLTYNRSIQAWIHTGMISIWEEFISQKNSLLQPSVLLSCYLLIENGHWVFCCRIYGYLSLVSLFNELTPFRRWVRITRQIHSSLFWPWRHFELFRIPPWTASQS